MTRVRLIVKLLDAIDISIHFITQIRGCKLPENSNSLKVKVGYAISIEKLERQIELLTRKMNNELNLKNNETSKTR